GYLPSLLLVVLLPLQTGDLGQLRQRTGPAAQFALRPARRLGCGRGAACRRLFLILLPADAFAAQGDLAFADVDTEDLDLDLVADLDDVLGALDLVVGQLADVQQALQTGLQLDEDAEVGELGDLALLDLTGAVTAGDVALPRVVVHLLEAK